MSGSGYFQMSVLLSWFQVFYPLRTRLMTAHGSEFFTMNEVNRLKILQDVIDNRLTTRLAALRLNITDRHCRRLLERYRQSGPLSVANRRRGMRKFCDPGLKLMITAHATAAIGDRKRT